MYLLMNPDRAIPFLLRLAELYRTSARLHPIGSDCWWTKRRAAKVFQERAERLGSNGSKLVSTLQASRRDGPSSLV